MKRDKSLIPLSQDHHGGLMLAQLIKKNAPQYEGLPANIKGKINYTIEKWENELKPHFKNEENILFPFISGNDSEIDKLMVEILNEHKILSRLINKLYSEENKIELLNDIGVLLEKHIRKEERHLFERVQDVFKTDLKKLEGKIVPVSNSCKT